MYIRSKKLTVFTHTRSAWCINREIKARAYSGCAAVSIDKLIVCWEQVGKRVVAGGDVEGAGDVIERMDKG